TSKQMSASSRRIADVKSTGRVSVVANSPKIVDPMPTMIASTMTLIPEATTLPSVFSARNEVLPHNANGTRMKLASVVSLNSIRVTKSCTDKTKKASTIRIQHNSRIRMVGRLVRTSKPENWLVSSSSG